MTFSNFASHLGKIEATAKRNEMTTLLVKLLKEAPPSEIDKVVYLSLGQLAPLYAHKEFGLAEKMVIRAIARTYHKDESVVKDLYKKTGDLGVTTQFFSSNHSSHSNHSHRSVSSVFSSLIAIAEEAGSGSQEKKLDRVATLLTSLNPESVRYVVRIILDKLRLGFSDKTVLDALSVMTSGDKSDREKLESIYNVRPDVGWLAKAVKRRELWVMGYGSGMSHGEKLKKSSPSSPLLDSQLTTHNTQLSPKLGTPVLPALCQRLPSTEEIVEKMCRPSTQSRGRVPVGPRILDNVGTSSIEGSGGNVAVEPKWDGQRIQAHAWILRKKDIVIKLFTRSLEDVTAMFPDLLDSLKSLFKPSSFFLLPSSFILDGEVVGIDPKSGNVLPFQTMITRKRKYGIQEQLLNVPIKYMVFDILYFNGKSLMDKPFSKRREILETIFNHFDHSSHFNHSVSLAPQLVTNDPVKIRDFLKEQIDRGLEGIVAKQIDAPYSPGRTGFTWVKMKWEGDAKSGGLLDTIDCVVMGVYAGRGKRSGFGVGAFLVGILGYRSSVVGFRLPVNRFSVSQSKTGKPITDKHVTENREQRTDNGIFLTISKIGTGLTDEQWKELRAKSKEQRAKSKPKEYDVPKELTPDAWLEPKIVVEIQADNITKSPLHTAGFALRFPRLVRYRTDKRPEQITTLKEVKRLYAPEIIA